MKCIAAATTNDFPRLQAADVLVPTMEELKEDLLSNLKQIHSIKCIASD